MKHRTFCLQIRIEDDCFQGMDGPTEIARILRAAAVRVVQGQQEISLMSIDESLVGYAGYYDREETKPCGR